MRRTIKSLVRKLVAFLSDQISKLVLLFFESKIAKWIIKFIAKIGVQRHLIHGEQIREIISKMQAGDAVLVRAFGEATTFFISGEYTHCLIKDIEPDKIIDATALGVQRRDILNCFIGVSKVQVQRPRLDEAQRIKIAQNAAKYIGRPYDFEFGLDNDSLYCSELYYHCYNEVNPGQLVLLKRFGQETITPDDIAKCSRLFERIV